MRLVNNTRESAIAGFTVHSFSHGWLMGRPRKTIHVKRKTKAILRPFGCQDGVRVGSGVSQVLAAFVTT
jgi:hypothetical protein